MNSLQFNYSDRQIQQNFCTVLYKANSKIVKHVLTEETFGKCKKKQAPMLHPLNKCPEKRGHEIDFAPLKFKCMEY